MNRRAASPRAPKIRKAPDHLPLGLIADADALKAAFDGFACITITDLAGRITFANEKFCEVSKYSRAELLGHDHRILNSGEHPKTFFAELWETIKRGNIWHGKVRNKAKDGSFFWSMTTIVPCFDAKHRLRQFVAIQTEVIEQKRTGAEFSERYRLQQLLAELTTRFVAVGPSQIDGAMGEALQLIVEGLGLDRSTLSQTNGERGEMVLTHQWQRAGLPESREELSSAALFPWVHAKVLAGELICFCRTEELPPEASHDIESFREMGVRAMVAFPLQASGNAIGFISFTMLTSDRVWQEEEILELKVVAQIMGTIIARKNSELREEQARHELAHAMRLATLGELSSALAHELNQPLAAILSNTQAARRFLADGTINRDELTSILDDIVRDDKRAGAVIHQLRAMVTKERSTCERCDMNQIIREVLEMMHSEMIEEGVHLRVMLTSEPCVIEARRVELQQVLMNLVLNGIQAMKETAPPSRTIEIHTQIAGPRVLTAVIDHGPGIPPDRLAKVFEPFYSTKPDGLGIGLALCRRIVEGHAGTIQATTALQGGACFTFLLPLK